jgi:hypothetical protein
VPQYRDGMVEVEVSLACNLAWSSPSNRRNGSQTTPLTSLLKSRIASLSTKVSSHRHYIGIFCTSPSLFLCVIVRPSSETSLPSRDKGLICNGKYSSSIPQTMSQGRALSPSSRYRRTLSRDVMQLCIMHRSICSTSLRSYRP